MSIRTVRSGGSGEVGGRAKAVCYCLVGTAIGPIGLAWSGDGLTRLQLPEADEEGTERALIAALPAGSAAAHPPGPVRQAILELKRYGNGARSDFAGVALDLAGISPFHRRVYAAARALGWGETASYGELASAIGVPGAARAVGLALKRNPLAIIIPCHRVLASGKKLGGFSAFGGTWTKRRLLALEGVAVAAALPVLPGLPPPQQ